MPKAKLNTTEADRYRNLALAYARTFSTGEGETVLKDLKRRFYDCNMDSAEIERAAGRRDVVKLIIDMVKAHERTSNT